LQEVLQEWNLVWQTARPVLQVHAEGSQLRIVDTRPIAHRRDWMAGEMEAEVYRLCDSAQTPASLMKQISARRGGEVSAEQVQTAIQTLCDARIILQMNGKLLGLGVIRPEKRRPPGDFGSLGQSAFMAPNESMNCK
jgi:hypothetical protein